MLPVPYFHITVTVPAELRAPLRAHQRDGYAVLMQATAAAIIEIARDPRFVGGTVAVLAVLHTWDQRLDLHPHVHCLVSGGGLSADGSTWHPARRGFLLPAVLALTSRATIFGFNVRPDPAKKIIEREKIDVRYYSVIYELLDDIKQVLSGMLAPEIREEILGLAEVRDVFRSPRYGQVAGCMVVDGTIFRNKKVRVLSDNVVIHEGELDSLRRFKDDVNEVRNGLECGIGVRNYDVKVGDKIEVFDTKEIARAL